MYKQIVGMRILFIHHSPVFGGASKSLSLLIKELTKRGNSVHVVCPGGKPRSVFEKAGASSSIVAGVSSFDNSYGVPTRGLRWLVVGYNVLKIASERGLRDVIKNFRPDVVHVNDRGLIHSAFIAWKVGVPVVMHARYVSSMRATWYKRFTDRLIVKYVDYMVAIDKSVERTLPSGVESAVIYNPLDSVDALSAEEKKKDGIVVFGFVAAIREFKGIWDLIEAVKLLRDRSDFKVLIAGGNTRPDQFFRSIRGRLALRFGLAENAVELLLEKIQKYGISHLVEHHGVLENIDDFFDGCDVNVFPSHLNGAGRCVFESGIRKVPSIIALRNPVDDIVEDGVNGLIVEERNPQALADAMVNMIENSSQRHLMAEKSQSKFREIFSSNRSAEDVLEVYRKLLSSNGA